MSESPAKTLANMSIGTLATALGPLAIVVWQGAAWAGDIEANVEANQKQIEVLVEQMKADDLARNARGDRIFKLLEKMIESNADTEYATVAGDDDDA